MSENASGTLLNNHSKTHSAAANFGTTNAARDRGRKLDVGVSEVQRNVFRRCWDAFSAGSNIDACHAHALLFECAGDDIDNGLLKSDPDILSKSAADITAAMPRSVTRAELFFLRQECDETFCAFSVRARGKADTCTYSVSCTCGKCVNFTDAIVMDVLIAGVSDLDIIREVLGTVGIIDQPVNIVKGW